MFYMEKQVSIKYAMLCSKNDTANGLVKCVLIELLLRCLFIFQIVHNMYHGFDGMWYKHLTFCISLSNEIYLLLLSWYPAQQSWRDMAYALSVQNFQ